MTLKEAYSYAVVFLERNGIDESDFKALCIVCSILGIKNSDYEAHKDDFVQNKKLADMLWKLKSGQPLQYVIGKWYFYESVVYDLCSGSGCIGISIAKKCSNAFVYLIEKSDDALFYLKKNADKIKNVKVLQGDICNIKEFDFLENADVIISNPPYIRQDELANLQSEVKNEPLMALDGGKDGLDFYRVINDNWYSKLNDKGKLFLEIGNEQGESIFNVLYEFENISVIKDLYGNDRIVSANKK